MKSSNDINSNKVFELNQNKALNQIQYEKLYMKLTLLQESIEAMSNAKDMQDKHEIIIEKYKSDIKLLQTERDDIKDV